MFILELDVKRYFILSLYFKIAHNNVNVYFS